MAGQAVRALALRRRGTEQKPPGAVDSGGKMCYIYNTKSEIHHTTKGGIL